MHRAYQPITPANNKLLKKRWDDRRFDRHRQKVRSAQAVIDNKPPQTYMHLHLKLKKLQVEEERLAIIERDNRILLEKMCYIMRTRGRVDCENDYEQKSLNRTKRQREILRVTHENQAILRRILSKEANYSHQQWEHEWALNKQYMANIAKYPQNYTLTKNERKFYEHQQQQQQQQRQQQRQEAAKNSKVETMKSVIHKIYIFYFIFQVSQHKIYAQCVY
ncbi:sperm axonemal maintenance protein CFAP97D1-like [Patiria miniata]|uniref:Cilia- and flagella-associated protein 97 n=1 Tax=Patiria miniata TaxID=46514 RepID=A0A914A584_PATMI|nr:sperm axonemal maintenance protein CFAP97D1-like [Patiria miniata]